MHRQWSTAGNMDIGQAQCAVGSFSRCGRDPSTWFRDAWLQPSDEIVRQAATEIARNCGVDSGSVSTVVEHGSRGAPLEGSSRDRRSSAMIKMEARWLSVMTRGQDGESTETAPQKHRNSKDVGRLLVEDAGDSGTPSWVCIKCRGISPGDTLECVVQYCDGRKSNAEAHLAELGAEPEEVRQAQVEGLGNGRQKKSMQRRTKNDVEVGRRRIVWRLLNVAKVVVCASFVFANYLTVSRSIDISRAPAKDAPTVKHISPSFSVRRIPSLSREQDNVTINSDCAEVISSADDDGIVGQLTPLSAPSSRCKGVVDAFGIEDVSQGDVAEAGGSVDTTGAVISAEPQVHTRRRSGKAKVNGGAATWLHKTRDAVDGWRERHREDAEAFLLGEWVD